MGEKVLKRDCGGEGEFGMVTVVKGGNSVKHGEGREG